MAATRRPWREHRREQVLRRRLAGRAGDRDRPAAPSARRHERASACSPASGSSVVSSTPGCSRSVVARRTRARRARPTRRPPAPPRRSGRRRRSRPRSPTNRSPGRTSRESIVTRAGPGGPSGASVAGRASWTPAASATRSGDQSRTQCLPRDADVVEGQLAPVLELLALLVALAGDRRRRRPAPASATARSIAAWRSTIASTSPRRRIRDPGEDLVDDRRRILRARVVRGDDRVVGQAGGDRAHLRALAAVAVAAAAEDARAAGPRPAAARRVSTFSSESGVCA